MDTLRDRRRQEELLRVAEQAAEWLITLDEGAAQERAAFAEWIEESPLHVEMFLRASAVNQIRDLLDPADRRKLAESVVTEARHSNVVTLQASPLAPPQRSSFARKGRSHSQWFAGIAAAIATIAVVAWWYIAGPSSWERYATAVGEQRAVALADGSMVYVNTDTRIDIRYSGSAREVRLRSGEALFKVAHDAQRPFRVHVGDTIVQAVGTQFNIYRRSAQTRVAVVEGIVQVSNEDGLPLSAPLQRPRAPSDAPLVAAQSASAESAHKTKRLAAGQAVNLGESGAIETMLAVNVEQVTAWRQRRLVFEWETLGVIAEEFNRYNRAPRLRVEGDGVRDRRYTAVFDADNPQALLKFLAKDSALVFAAEGDDFVIRGR